jgi:hypothetical protein
MANEINNNVEAERNIETENRNCMWPAVAYVSMANENQLASMKYQ